ncbi:hypothetical protein Bca4012_098970 [Brassica carinata]|uniref:Uncharacterized protein n=1 Tax=Brassica carinata TaxID=52824 RepID=A0A8X7PKV7_BRACI|nr:hypothetical protein Bca52824_081620 [Brassica carinata]
MVDPLSIAIPAIGDQVGAEASAGSIRDRPRRTKVDLSVHRGRHQVFERVVSASLSSSVPGIPSQRRVSGEGTSRMGPAQAALEAMEASNKYAALMEMRLTDFPSREEVEEHLLMIQRLRADLEAAQVRDQWRTEKVEELNGKLILSD